MNINHHDTSHWRRRVALFLISQNISLFGSAVVGFAIVWHITLETSSGKWLMLSTLFGVVPQIMISLFGGVWADRYNRKVLIMAADGFIALATFGLALAFMLGYGRLELLLAVSAVRSLGGGIQMPAVGAIYPQLVPQDKLTKVQGISQTLSSVLLLIAPAVGGVVLSSLGIVGAFFVDVVTAALAIVVMSFIKVAKVERSDNPLSMWSDLKEGLGYTFSHPVLRRIILYYMLSFFLVTPAIILSPLMVERTFGSDVWRLTANEVVWTVGSLIGGLFVSIKGEFKDKIKTVALCLVAFGVLFAILGMAASFFIFLVIMGLSGLFLPPMHTAQTVHIQEITEPQMLGRVFSIVQLISGSAMPLAIILFGPMADAISVESILIGTGAALTVVGLLYGRKPQAKKGVDDMHG